MNFETTQERKERLNREYQRHYRQRRKENGVLSNSALQKRQKRAADQIGKTEEDIVERRSAIAQQVKRSRRAHIQVMSVNEHYCSAMTFICKYCRFRVRKDNTRYL